LVVVRKNITVQKGETVLFEDIKSLPSHREPKRPSRC
jgi:hypothetical protein